MTDRITGITEAVLKSLDAGGNLNLEWCKADVELVPLADALQRLANTLQMEKDRRRQAAEALDRSENVYLMLFESNPLPMIIFDLETLAVTSVNHAAERMYGYTREEFLGIAVRDIRPPEDIPSMLHTMGHAARPLNVVNHARHLKKDGTVLDVEIYSHELTFQGRRSRLVMINDITERKRLEEQLVQTQKMEAIGQLAGGVAHDFNNMLSVIIGYTELIKTRAAGDDLLYNNICEIERAAFRSRDTARQLLAFSRKQIISPKVINLNDQVNLTVNTLARLIGETIDLEFLPNPEIRSIKADPSQIDQILINLAINARDAMPSGGRLTIETGNIDLGETFCNEHMGGPPGPYVFLKVRDSGVGMPAQVLAHVFEPYFTTKDVGKGTGLGLATVYGIVRQNKGMINVVSEPDRGSTFEIYLPGLENRMNSESPRQEDLTVPGAGTILLVEDDEMIRRMSTTVLTKLGYAVVPKMTPEEALAYTKVRGNPVDLLLTDIVMPGMNGIDLYAHIARARPDIKVLFMSGYAADVISNPEAPAAGRQFIQKPFTIRELAHKVRDAIQSK